MDTLTALDTLHHTLTDNGIPTRISGRHGGVYTLSFTVDTTYWQVAAARGGTTAMLSTSPITPAGTIDQHHETLHRLDLDTLSDHVMNTVRATESPDNGYQRAANMIGVFLGEGLHACTAAGRHP